MCSRSAREISVLTSSRCPALISLVLLETLHHFGRNHVPARAEYRKTMRPHLNLGGDRLGRPLAPADQFSECGAQSNAAGLGVNRSQFMNIVIKCHTGPHEYMMHHF